MSIRNAELSADPTANAGFNVITLCQLLGTLNVRPLKVLVKKS